MFANEPAPPHHTRRTACAAAPSKSAAPLLVPQRLPAHHSAMGCTSSRNVESKKNKILEEAQKALEERRKLEAIKTQLLDKYFRAHAEGKRHDADAQSEAEPSAKRDAKLQQTRDCIQLMSDFKLETGFKPGNLQRDEPVFLDPTWMEFLDVKGVQVSLLVEMDSDAQDMLSRCKGFDPSPQDVMGRILLRTRETAEAARRSSVELVQGAAQRAQGLIPGRA